MTDPAVEATVEQPGLTEGRHCEVCGEVLTAQTEVAYVAPEPEPEPEPEPLYLDFVNYSELTAEGYARYEIDALADTELALFPETDSNGALTYQWQRYDAEAEDEALRWVNVNKDDAFVAIEDDAEAQLETLTVTPTAEMLNVADLLHCVVTAAAEDEEPLTGYAMFTLKTEAPTTNFFGYDSLDEAGNAYYSITIEPEAESIELTVYTSFEGSLTYKWSYLDAESGEYVDFDLEQCPTAAEQTLVLPCVGDKTDDDAYRCAVSENSESGALTHFAFFLMEIVNEHTNSIQLFNSNRYSIQAGIAFRQV